MSHLKGGDGIRLIRELVPDYPRLSCDPVEIMFDLGERYYAPSLVEQAMITYLENQTCQTCGRPRARAVVVGSDGDLANTLFRIIGCRGHASVPA